MTNNDERYAELTAIEKRVIVKESKRQNNINNVVTIAAQSTRMTTTQSNYIKKLLTNSRMARFEADLLS